MSLEAHWFLPLHGDGRYLASTEQARPTSLDYLAAVARAADTLGFTGLLLPNGRSCEDAWVAASAMAALTRRVRFIVAQRSTGISPTIAARMSATFDRLSSGRLGINAITGADRSELAGDGVHLEHDARYAVTDEFLSVWRALMAGRTVTHHGAHLRIDEASLMFKAITRPHPPIYFGGSSDAAIAVAARHADVYLTFGEPLESAREKIERVRRLAEAQERRIRFGIRFHVIARETESEAFAAADKLISRVSAESAAQAQRKLSGYESEGQRRMSALHGGDRSRLWLGPNLWAGIGLVRGYAGTALVGTGEAVAERLREYAGIGIDTFILSGYPHLEEAYRFAELVFPHLDMAESAPDFAEPKPQGEILAHMLPERQNHE
jgi:alkanesulfonate monooxygenase